MGEGEGFGARYTLEVARARIVLGQRDRRWLDPSFELRFDREVARPGVVRCFLHCGAECVAFADLREEDLSGQAPLPSPGDPADGGVAPTPVQHPIRARSWDEWLRRSAAARDDYFAKQLARRVRDEEGVENPT
jgi:hypothetical protein